MTAFTVSEHKDAAVVIPTASIVVPAATDSSKKYRIALCVLTAVTVLAVVGAFIAVFHMHTVSVDKLVKHMHTSYRDHEGKRYDEDIDVDRQENVAAYTITGEDGDVYQVVEDYGRKLLVVKSPDASDPCLVTVLNTTTSAADVQEMQTMLVDNEEMEKEEISLVRTKALISQTDFLPAKAKAMCKGRNVYWATEECDQDKTGVREKRAIYRCRYFCIRRGGRWYCYIILSTCVRIA